MITLTVLVVGAISCVALAAAVARRWPWTALTFRVAGTIISAMGAVVEAFFDRAEPDHWWLAAGWASGVVLIGGAAWCGWRVLNTKAGCDTEVSRG